jgi:hypothetical protein
MLVFSVQAQAADVAAPSTIVQSDSTNAPLTEYDVLPIRTGQAALDSAASDSIRARTRRDHDESVTTWVEEHEERVQRDVVARYRYFADDGMNEAYTQCFGLLFNQVSFSRTMKKMGLGGPDIRLITNTVGRGEIGIMVSTGSPLRWSEKFEVIDSNLYLITMPAAITILHGLKSGDAGFTPYFGWGLGGIFGFERLSGRVTRANQEVAWHDNCYRQAFEGHALLGAQWKTGERTAAILEVRWTQAGRGRLKRAAFTQEQREEGADEVFAEFQHPNFRFTGMSVDVGIRW